MVKTEMANQVWKKIKCYWRKIFAKCSDKTLSPAEYLPRQERSVKLKDKAKYLVSNPKGLQLKLESTEDLANQFYKFYNHN